MNSVWYESSDTCKIAALESVQVSFPFAWEKVATEEKIKKKNGKNSGSLMSLPVDRLNGIACNADARAKIIAGIVATNIIASQPTATPTARANIKGSLSPYPPPIRNTWLKALVFISYQYSSESRVTLKLY